MSFPLKEVGEGQDADGGKLYQKNVNLFGRIDPSRSVTKVMSTKVELHLVKETPVAWASLESGETAKIIQPHIYPSSSKVKHDWESVGRNLADENERNSVDDFFKELYSSADEDTRRAMQKSFVRSVPNFLNKN